MKVPGPKAERVLEPDLNGELAGSWPTDKACCYTEEAQFSRSTATTEKGGGRKGRGRAEDRR